MRIYIRLYADFLTFANDIICITVEMFGNEIDYITHISEKLPPDIIMIYSE